MKAGFYEADITPAIGMEQPGGYGKAYIRAIHDPLKARAAVIDDGRERVALVGLDTLSVQSAEAVRLIREAVEARCGIPGDHVMIGASHTHQGGPFFGSLPRDFADAPALVRELLANHSTIADPVYTEQVIAQTVTAICEADRTKRDALLSVGSGYEDRVAFNRRFKMKWGREVTHPGKGNPDIAEPAGPIDPEVGVLAAWTPEGELLGCVVNYACHGTTFSGGVSADWIHWMIRTVRGAMGPEATVVFLNGACGDITQVNNRSLAATEYGARSAAFVGTRVGAEAVKVLATAERGELGPVRAVSRTLHIERRAPSPDRVRQSRELTERMLASGERNTEWTFAKELVIYDHLYKTQPVVSVEVQAIQVGPAVFVSNPAEYFCRLGLEIKEASPFPFTYVVELANGCVGYVPTEEAFAPTGGGYETVLTSYSNLEPRAGGLIAEAGIDLARSLTPGATPEPPVVETPPADTDSKARVWDYGILGPDLE